MEINFLLLSVGTRNKIVEYFKDALSEPDGCYGRVIATDMSETAPALYEADGYYIVPAVSDPSYIDTIIDICKKENIKGLTSLIDPELSILAENKDRFEAAGVTVIGSSRELCDISFDKFKMYEWLTLHNYLTVKSYVSAEAFESDFADGNVTFPVLLKPVCGSASQGITKVSDMDVLKVLLERNSDLMIQEYMDAKEIGVDVYIDMISGEVVSVFAKEKLLMRAGETDKSVSYKDDKLFELVEKFVLEAGFTGQVDIDIFERDGEYYISEVNPRFGGGYPHAHECGCNHMVCIINNLSGISNKPDIGSYESGVYMMKYSEIEVRKI